MKHFGAFWLDNVMPIALGFLAGYATWMDGGSAVNMPAGAAIGWCVWQLGRWVERWWKGGKDE